MKFITIKYVAFLCLLTCPIVLTAKPIQADITRGKQTAMLCVACHMQDGQGKDNPAPLESWPRLAGLDALYIQRQIELFKSGARQSPTMLPFATMLDEQKAADVAAYFNSLAVPKITVAKKITDKKLLALGKKLVTRGDWERYIPACSSCHGQALEGIGDSFPALANQHAGYLSKQLENWQTGVRKNDPQSLMKNVAKRLTKQDIQAVSAWIAQSASKLEGAK